MAGLVGGTAFCGGVGEYGGLLHAVFVTVEENRRIYFYTTPS